MSGGDTGKANGAGQVEAGGGEVSSGGSREDVEWNGTLKNIAKRGEAAGGETDVDDLSRDGEYTAAETDAMHAQAIADERRQRDAEEEEREGIRTAAAKFKGYAPANVSAMSRGMHFKRVVAEADGSGTVSIGGEERSSQEPVGDNEEGGAGAEGVAVVGSSSDAEPESVVADGGGESGTGGVEVVPRDEAAGDSVGGFEAAESERKNGALEKDLDSGDGSSDESGVGPGGDAETSAGTEGAVAVDEPVTGVSEAEGGNNKAVRDEDGIKAVVVEGVDGVGTEKAEAAGEGEGAVGQKLGSAESLESGGLEVGVERPVPQGAVGGGKASLEVAGSKPAGVGEASEARLVAAIDALPGKVVKAVEGRIAGWRNDGSVRVDGMVALEHTVKGVSAVVNGVDGRVAGVADVLVKMLPEIRGVFRGELEPLTTTFTSSIAELTAEMPKIEGGEAVKMEQAAQAVGKAGKAVSEELVGYRADFQKWQERQRDRRNWVLAAVGVVGTPALVALGIFAQLQFGVVAIADPSNGWRDIVWSAYGREVAVCMQNARKSGAPVRCALKVAP